MPASMSEYARLLSRLVGAVVKSTSKSYKACKVYNVSKVGSYVTSVALARSYYATNTTRLVDAHNT
jgi:hypothetical protein